MQDSDGVVDAVYIVNDRQWREEKHSSVPLAAFPLSERITNKIVIDGV